MVCEAALLLDLGVLVSWSNFCACRKTWATVLLEHFKIKQGQTRGLSDTVQWASPEDNPAVQPWDVLWALHVEVMASWMPLTAGELQHFKVCMLFMRHVPTAA